MKNLILFLLIIISNHVLSQEITGVYVKKKSRYEPKYNNTLLKVDYKVNKDDQGEYKVTIVMDMSLPEFLFPVIRHGVAGMIFGNKSATQKVFYSKPIKHKLFDDFVFFTPLFDLDAKYKTVDKWQGAAINCAMFYVDTFYVDKSKVEADPLMSVGYSPTKEPIDFLQSFYFKKFEVTNKEYREFTEWVRDSIAMEFLVGAGFDEFKIPIGNNKYRLNWENRDKIWKLESEEAYDALRSLYIPVHDGFYRKKPIDTKILVYNNIKIYPDTTVWLPDYSYKFNEPLFRDYFWHPVYEDSPVVGISWEQAKAFCNWKTKMLNIEMGKTNFPYRLEVDLPAEYERDYVLTKYNTWSDVKESYITALHYDNNIMKWELGNNLIWKKTGTYKKDGFVYTHPVDISKIKTKDFTDEEKTLLLADLTKDGISGLKSNVSEWMKESYQENWLPTLTMRQQLYQSIDYKKLKKELAESKDQLSEQDYEVIKKDIELLEKYYTSVYPIRYQLEKEFDNLVDKDGKLVKGSNWHDETFERTRIEEAKTFISPNKSYSTVGFRYVIHVYPKE